MELELFKESIEEYIGRKVHSDDLANAIKVYNENRSLLSAIYKLNLKDNPPVPGSTLFGILMSGFIMPKEEHNVMFRRFLENMPESGPSTDERMHLMVAGNTFETVEIFQAIEDCGADVVIDDLDFGTRYFTSLVKESGNPFRALAERYILKVPCPCKHPADDRMAHLLRLAREYRVKGVILVNQKYCDTHLYDRPLIESELKRNGLPALLVEHSDTGWAGGKFKTMVQAFIEMAG
jgi:benzoyl-CoA reductase subunit C